MTTTSNTTAISMRLSKSTIDNVEWIKAASKENNRTQIMGIGVKLLKLVIEARQKGGLMTIEHKDGSKERISLLGL